ncbi:MAG: sporulation protein YabP [Clostridiales bacterium]|jgi:sporulation protein YabP|nr:sporulation protein YabP [Clostridiales bacterium]
MERKLPDPSSKRLRTHVVHLENRETINITGVKAIDSFNESEVLLITELGELHIEGNDLNITKFDLDDGQVIVEGEIISLQYLDVAEQKQGSFFSRMFR